MYKYIIKIDGGKTIEYILFLRHCGEVHSIFII
jgi:hypothetical protein